eukprot:GEMP01104383.1.p1 GENE.GEMP01104383.1~~GEMP01104383.1.p1  ORF type:complete len:214 (+),score=42.51 GEMP01104383.1:48-644(+)
MVSLIIDVVMVKRGKEIAERFIDIRFQTSRAHLCNLCNQKIRCQRLQAASVLPGRTNANKTVTATGATAAKSTISTRVRAGATVRTHLLTIVLASTTLKGPVIAVDVLPKAMCKGGGAEPCSEEDVIPPRTPREARAEWPKVADGKKQKKAEAGGLAHPASGVVKTRKMASAGEILTPPSRATATVARARRGDPRDAP